MPPQVALVRGVSPSFARSLCMATPSEPIDVPRALAQHARYVAELGRRVARVIELPADPALPDCCFVEDTAVVVGARALVTRPGAEARRGEPPATAVALRALGLAPIEMTAPATLDGGDVLVSGRTILVGRSTRTDEGGVAWLRRAFPEHAVLPLPVEGSLHLKSVVTEVAPGRFLVEDGDAGRIAWRELLRALPDARPTWVAEPHGANVLRVGDALFHLAGRPRLRAALEALALGLELVELDMSELEKADGGLTCLSVLCTPV